jgi:hypothetical protein
MTSPLCGSSGIKKFSSESLFRDIIQTFWRSHHEKSFSSSLIITYQPWWEGGQESWSMGNIKRARLPQNRLEEHSAYLKLLIYNFTGRRQWEDYFEAASRNPWSEARSEKSIPSKRKAEEQGECFEMQKSWTFHMILQFAQWGFFKNFLFPVWVKVVDPPSSFQTTFGVRKAFTVSSTSP